MGFAKLLGRDRGISYTKELMAFEVFLYWALTGWVFCFGLSMLFIHPPNIVIPAIIYLLGICFLLARYLILDKRKDES